MTHGGWNTTEDVLKDLARVTGVRAADFEEGFILRGQKPPPPLRRFADEDEEMRLRFGSLLTERGDHEDVASIPDFGGITDMLNLVNSLDTPENEKTLTENEGFPASLKEHTITISKPVVSSLNPNVQEFVPNSSKSTDVGKMKNDSNGLNNLKKEIIEACADKILPNTKDIKDQQSSGDKNNDEEKVRMAEILKNKIIQASKAKTMQNKRERNVAIAALMKLNSTSPDSITPKEVSIPNSPKKTPRVESPNASGPSSPKPILVTPEYFQENRVESKQDIDPSVQESIEKVKNWLNKPETPKPKAPTVYLEPDSISFKKKGASSSSSPSSIAKGSPIENSSSKTVVKVSPIAAKAPIASTPSFVPSSYANDLMKKYQERSKAKETQGMDIWTKLEYDLKAKDEQIKNRERQSVDENQNDTLS